MTYFCKLCDKSKNKPLKSKNHKYLEDLIIMKIMFFPNTRIHLKILNHNSSHSLRSLVLLYKYHLTHLSVISD